MDAIMTGNTTSPYLFANESNCTDHNFAVVHERFALVVVGGSTIAIIGIVHNVYLCYALTMIEKSGPHPGRGKLGSWLFAILCRSLDFWLCHFCA